MLGRGVEAILDTTYLSLVATPIAGLLGMGIAFLVVRKSFSGKAVLDFGSNLGAGVPGTILGIGFVLSFVTPPWIVVGLLYLLLALFLVRTLFKEGRRQAIVLLVGSAIAALPRLLELVVGDIAILYILGGCFIGVGVFLFIQRAKQAGWILVGMGLYLIMADLIWYITRPISLFSLQVENEFLRDSLAELGEYIQVLFQMPPVILMIVYLFGAVLILGNLQGRVKVVLSIPAAWTRRLPGFHWRTPCNCGDSLYHHRGLCRAQPTCLRTCGGGSLTAD